MDRAVGDNADSVLQENELLFIKALWLAGFEKLSESLDVKPFEEWLIFEHSKQIGSKFLHVETSCLSVYIFTKPLFFLLWSNFLKMGHQLHMVLHEVLFLDPVILQRQENHRHNVSQYFSAFV